MPEFRKLLYVILVLILAFGFVSCDDDSSSPTTTATPTPTTNLITITWNNQTTFTVDFFLDGEFAQQVLSGQTGVTTGVMKGTHMLYACPETFEPSDNVCEGEELDLDSDFTYTIM